jgi:hypothetical protein
MAGNLDAGLFALEIPTNWEQLDWKKTQDIKLIFVLHWFLIKNENTIIYQNRGIGNEI